MNKIKADVVLRRSQTIYIDKVIQMNENGVILMHIVQTTRSLYKYLPLLTCWWWNNVTRNANLMVCFMAFILQMWKINSECIIAPIYCLTYGKKYCFKTNKFMAWEWILFKIVVCYTKTLLLDQWTKIPKILSLNIWIWIQQKC